MILKKYLVGIAQIQQKTMIASTLPITEYTFPKENIIIRLRASAENVIYFQSMYFAERGKGAGTSNLTIAKLWASRINN